MCSQPNAQILPLSSLHNLQKAQRRRSTQFDRMIDLRPLIIKWTSRRRAAVVIAVRSGAVSLEQACQRYELSVEEPVDRGLKARPHQRQQASDAGFGASSSAVVTDPLLRFSAITEWVAGTNAVFYGCRDRRFKGLREQFRGIPHSDIIQRGRLVIQYLIICFAASI